ncbi:PRC-barrel domain containing protein [Glycocaulis profundi]|nr:PRC-barrel domain containing protein [Glycocaulis profundi]
MKTMLIASSALTLLAAPALAQDPAQQTGDPTAQQPGAADQQRDDGMFDWFDDGHPLEGTPVYTSDGERVGSVERVRGGAGPDAHAELDADATADLDAQGLVIETGGFLGIGTREVHIEPGQAERTSVDGDERIVLDMSHDEFERQPEHDRDGDLFNGNGAGDDRARDRTGQPGDDRRAADEMGQQRTDRADHQRDDGMFDWFDDGHPLEGTPVYTSDGERVGSVERVRGGAGPDAHSELDADATADLDAQGLVIETGGFLGIGTREVHIEPGQAERTSVDGDERIVLDMSHDEFERQPEHDRDGDLFDGNSPDDGVAGTRGRDAGIQADRPAATPPTDAGDAGTSHPGASNQPRPQTTERNGLDADRDARADASGEVHGDVYTDGHHWVGTPVYTSDGERVGSVDKVRSLSDTAYDDGGDTVAMTEAEPELDAVIVETGGFLGIGTREVEIEPDQAELEMVDGDARLVLDIDADAFRDLPEHHDRGDRDRRDGADW